MKKIIHLNSILVNQTNVLIVLKEKGPWKNNSFQPNFEKLQNRIYDCMEYALCGQMNQKYPETTGKKNLIIQLACTDLPSDQIEHLVVEMNKNNRSDELLQSELKTNEFVSKIEIQSVTHK